MNRWLKGDFKSPLARIERSRHDEVEVFGSPILVVETKDGAYFSPYHVCAAMGLSWQGQHIKISNDAGLRESRRDIVIVAAGGKNRTHVMLPLDLLSGWLFMINPNKVSPSVKPKLLKYRTEAFAVLDAWFRNVVGYIAGRRRWLRVR